MFFRKSRSSDEGEVAVAEREESPVDPAVDDEPAAAPHVLQSLTEAAPKSGNNKKDDEDELEYEWEVETPFGKLELEFEPRGRKEEKDRKKKEKAEREAAKKAAALARKAERAATKAGEEVVVVKRSNLVPALVIFAIIVTAIAVAVWLFARPGDEDDSIPDEFKADAPGEAAAPSDGIGARIKRAISAGRKASRDAQREQQQRFEEATRNEP